MYTNKCTKCGAEFETKNPKRVICPNCLYPDRKDLALKSYSDALNAAPTGENEQQSSAPANKPSGFFVAGESVEQQNYNRKREFSDGQQDYSHGRRDFSEGRRDFSQGRRDFQPRDGGYQGGGQGGFSRPRPQYRDGGYQGGFNRDSGNRYNNAPRPGGGFRPGGRPQGGGFRRPGPPQGRFQRDNRKGPAVNKKLLISREQVAEIEKYYKELLPLPNPDCHEVIAEKMGLESNKVFFGINLVRQKMKLPKLPFPKRKLAVSPDQLIAIKNLYAPLLPLPPIGCHKFISKQLRMDEWRVHVGIGILRKQMNLPRWNTEREDAPPEFKNQPVEAPSEEKETKKKTE